MGDDNRVVDAARVSFAKEAENYTEGQNGKLIQYLARHGHWTPFSHPVITVVESVPIFVARQRFKHMVGFTYNEVSRRYVDEEPTLYEPEFWRKRAENKKQGSLDEAVTKWSSWYDAYDGNIYGSDVVKDLNERALGTYKYLLDNGVAPEQARMVLPQSMYTEYYVTGSLAAFARAYKQRIDEHAQKEIRDLAKEWDKIIRPLFPVSWSVLVD
jgi:thymidylate synthase (FAD)